MKTTKFDAVIGVNAGYGETCSQKMSSEAFEALYLAIAEKVFAQTGIYIRNGSPCGNPVFSRMGLS